MDASINKRKALSAAMLLAASLIWGLAFVAQSAAMEHMGPFTVSAVRCALAALALVPCFLLFDRLGVSGYQKKDAPAVWRAGVTLGAVLFVAINLQQIGLQETGAGKAGFITALYIVVVPLFGLLMKKRVPRVVWPCALIAIAGLYFLCVRDGFSVGRGEMLLCLCTLAFAAQILLVSKYSATLDCIRLTCIQFLTVSVLSVPFMLLEKPVAADIAGAWLPIVYAGVCSGGVAYTFQMLGQKNIEPSAASLLMCPESVFAALGGWWILGETLTARELTGCALVFAAIVCSQIPWERLGTGKKDLPQTAADTAAGRQPANEQKGDEANAGISV